MNINQLLKRLSDAKRTSILVSHLEDIYTKDALTGLYNKHGYLHRETLLLQEAAENQSTVTCFLFDLNRLKYINDHYGHNEGILRFRSSDMPYPVSPVPPISAQDSVAMNFIC